MENAIDGISSRVAIGAAASPPDNNGGDGSGASLVCDHGYGAGKKNPAISGRVLLPSEVLREAHSCTNT